MNNQPGSIRDDSGDDEDFLFDVPPPSQPLVKEAPDGHLNYVGGPVRLLPDRVLEQRRDRKRRLVGRLNGEKR